MPSCRRFCRQSQSFVQHFKLQRTTARSSSQEQFLLKAACTRLPLSTDCTQAATQWLLAELQIAKPIHLPCRSSCRLGARLSLDWSCTLAPARGEPRLGLCCLMLRHACVLSRTLGVRSTIGLQRFSAASDRSYPPEPRVGVGVVILRPSQGSTEVMHT